MSVSLHVGALPAALLSPATLATPAHGAIASFIGVVRNHAHGRTVRSLHYQCYAGMAEKVLAQLIAEAATAHDPQLAASISHSTGDLVPGEASVAIHVASAHRAAAFAACRQLIERLKQDVPIWKHEHYADGTSAWLQGS